MDVRLPDGRILRNVPEGTTRAQIEAKLGRVSPVATAPEPAPARMASPVDETPRSSAGMSGVAGVNRGIAAVAGLPVDTALNVADLARAGYGTAASLFGRPDLAPEPINRLNFLGSGENIASGMNRLAIATQPQGTSTADRYAYAAGTGAPAALLTPQNALSGLLRGVAGGVAGQGAMDATGSPAAAVAASVLASGSPELGRGVSARIVRGGDDGQKAMQSNIAAFDRVGAKPSLGQATEGRAWRAVESVLSRTPGGAGYLASRGKEQQAAIGAGVDRLASSLSPRTNATVAGMQINRGVTDSFVVNSTSNLTQGSC